MATQTYLLKYLKQLLPEEKKEQIKISSFLKPTIEKEYNYSMDVALVEGNHFDIDILFFLWMKPTPVLLGPLVANSWKSNYFSSNIAVASPT